MFHCWVFKGRRTRRNEAEENRTRELLVVIRMGVTPVPIPNTMVKTHAADGTWLETARESRWLPDSFSKESDSFEKSVIGAKTGTWGCSSVGRAPALQAGGQEFEPLHLHFGTTFRETIAERLQVL